MTTAIERQRAAVAPFAHLLGPPPKIVEPTRQGAAVPPPRPRAEDGDDAETDDERTEREERERDKNKEETGRAETDEERRQREEDERDDNDEDASAEDKEDDDDEAEAKSMRNAPVALARRRERERCATIFSTKEAGARPDLAAHLAFQTTMPRHQAVALLKTMASGEKPAPQTQRAPLRTRMAETPIPEVGSDGGSTAAPTGSAAVANLIISAGKKRRGEI